MLGKHILPYFEKRYLSDITPYDIEKWLDTFAAKGLSNATANLGLAFLKIMLKEAIRREILFKDPSASILPLKTETVERGVLTQDEVSTLFNPENKKTNMGQ